MNISQLISAISSGNILGAMAAIPLLLAQGAIPAAIASKVMGDLQRGDYNAAKAELQSLLAAASPQQQLNDTLNHINDAINSGEASLPPEVQTIIAVMQGSKPKEDLIALAKMEFQAIKATIHGTMVNYFPSVVYQGRTYRWSTAEKSAEGVIAYIAACALSDASKLKTALGVPDAPVYHADGTECPPMQAYGQDPITITAILGALIALAPVIIGLVSWLMGPSDEEKAAAAEKEDEKNAKAEEKAKEAKAEKAKAAESEQMKALVILIVVGLIVYKMVFSKSA